MHVLIDNESLAKNERFKKFMKSACIQVASEAIAKKKLKHIQIAEKTHNAQTKQKNICIQKEEILLTNDYFTIQ